MKLREQSIPRLQLIVAALLIGVIGTYLLVNSRAATSCDQTVSSVSAAQSAMGSAAGGSTICMSAGTYGRITLQGVAPSSTVTLQPAPGATVTLGGVTLNGPGNTKNITVQGFYMTGSVQGLCGITGNVVFKYNTIQNLSKDFGFYFYARGCGGSGTQTGVSMLNNQIDHVGDCLTIAGGSGIEKNFTFNNNVCGPGIGKGATKSTDPSHYIEVGGIDTMTANNNTFEGPMDANYISAELHNNVFHIFGGGDNVDFSNNIIWKTQSRAQTILWQEGGYDNVKVDNNLILEDQSCFQNTACYTESMEIYAPHGMTVTNNTVQYTGLGLRFGETCGNGCSASGNTMTLQNNIVEPVSGQAANYAIWSCASTCVADHNVSADSSAVSVPSGAASIKNWTPSYTSTSWTPKNGEPYAAPPAGFYVATGSAAGLGWDGTGGPQGGVGAVAFDDSTPPPSDTTAPTISLTAPAANATVSGTATTVSATASDDTGVSGVQFKLDGNNLGSEDTSSPYSTTWNTTSASNGTHTLTAVARDAAGNTKTSSSVSVTVNNSTGGGSGGCTTVVSSISAAQTAVSSASPGQTVCLSNGTYGRVSLNANKAKPGVILRAQNPGQASIAGATMNGTNLTIAQFKMLGTADIGVGSTGMTVDHNFFDLDNYNGYGVFICASSTTMCNDVTITGNKFVGTAEEDTIRANLYHDSDGDGYGLRVEGNEFTGNTERGDHNDVFQSVWAGDHLVFRKNYLHDFGGQGFFVKDQDGFAAPGQPHSINGFIGDDNLIVDQDLPCDPASLCSGYQLSPFQIFGPIADGSMKHNTVGFGNGGGQAVLTGLYTNIDFSDNVFNSLAVTNSGGTGTTTTGSNNTYCQGKNPWPVPVGTTQDCNPAFINAAQGDYRQANGRGVTWKVGDFIYGPTDGTTTPPPPPTDTTIPTVAFSSPTNGATVSGTVTATATATDDTGVTKVEISLDGSLKMTDTASPYNYSFDSKTLTNGSHTLSAKAYDAAGNTKTATITITVNNADTTPPSVPSGLNATATSATTVNLTWNASTDTGTNASGIAKYNVLRGGVVIAQPTGTSYTDSTAVANTTYNYVVQAVDAAGNVSASSAADSVTTPAVPDTTAPSVPGNVSATAPSTNQVNLSWNASTDSGGSGLAGYNIYRGGTKLNGSPVTGTSYGDSTVSANTTYSYRVEAVDGAGNKSAQSTAASVKTPQAVRGDITGASGAPDGKINLFDLSYVIRNYNTANASGDISGPSGTPDGKIDLYDISYVIRNYSP